MIEAPQNWHYSFYQEEESITSIALLRVLLPGGVAFLIAEFFCGALHHFPDGQMIGAALLAQATLHTFTGGMRQRSVALFCPVRQAVAGEVAFKQECAGDADARSAGGTIIAAAAELGAQAIL